MGIIGPTGTFFSMFFEKKCFFFLNSISRSWSMKNEKQKITNSRPPDWLFFFWGGGGGGGTRRTGNIFSFKGGPINTTASISAG